MSSRGQGFLAQPCLPPAPEGITSWRLQAAPLQQTLQTILGPAVTKEDIRQNRDSVAARLGFLGRTVHGANPRAWVKELNDRSGEPVD